MAHEVTFTVPQRPLGKTDVEFDVKKNGTMFGTLKVSKGGIVWRSKNNTYGHFLSWNKVEEVATKYHTRRKVL